MNPFDTIAGVGQCLEKQACCDTVDIAPMRTSLERTKRRLEEKLNEVNAALQALNENPTVAQVLELVLKASRH